MNREVEKYYINRIDENHSMDFIKEALVTGIRSDNAELTRKAANALHFSGKFYGYFSPLGFAIKEMASAEVIKTLIDAGYDLSEPSHDLTPFDGSPQKLVDLLMEASGKTKEEVLQILAADINYFFHVIKTDYSCYRISYDIDSEDRYKPCFWNYLDEWLSAFIRLLAENKNLEIVDAYFVRSIIVNEELRKSFDTFFNLFSSDLSDDDLSWYVNIAVTDDNEYVFKQLINHRPELLNRIDGYPSRSKMILKCLFDNGLLLPGTDEGFNAFIPRIAFGENDKEILFAIAHPSYATRTAEEGKTSLMYAIENKDFPVELYKLLITSPSDVNIQDEYGQTALHYMAKTDYPECIEDLLKLGADPFITDTKGNNVLHILAGNKEGLSFDIFGDCVSLLPKKLLTMKNNKGMTPITLFFQRLTGMEEEPSHRLSFNQFLEQYLASPESLNGNILIGGSVKETRLKTLKLVKEYAIKQLNDREIEYELIAGKSPEETVSMLEKLADEGNEISDSSLHLVVIDELYDCQSPELGMMFEYAIMRLAGNDNVLIIAAAKLSSADIITGIIQQAFPYRITSLQASGMCSEIFIGQDDATYISKDEVIIKGFEDGILLCNLESDEKGSGESYSQSNNENDDSIVLAEAERILDKHLVAFKELAK